MREIMIEVLTKMPNEFSSNEFAFECRRMQVSDRYLHNNLAQFLHKQTTQHPKSRRLWVKEYKETPIIEEINQESKAIAFLKAKGYKISKKIEKWEEI